ncbi:MAG: hypothetical protein WCC87_05645 [Candidatus Korobacteraceae bacterium]
MSVLLTARGIGSLIGPLIASQWAGIDQGRLRHGVLVGFVIAGAGYVLLGISPTIWVAAAVVLLAHAGNSVVWVFSTTLLQLNTAARWSLAVQTEPLTPAPTTRMRGDSLDIRSPEKDCVRIVAPLAGFAALAILMKSRGGC